MPGAQIVDKDMEDASAVGVRGTPAFFINGRMISRAQAAAMRVERDEPADEPRQAGGGAQRERRALLPPGDLQEVLEERLRLPDRAGVPVARSRVVLVASGRSAGTPDRRRCGRPRWG
jgi:hypothetical protein